VKLSSLLSKSSCKPVLSSLMKTTAVIYIVIYIVFTKQSPHRHYFLELSTIWAVILTKADHIGLIVGVIKVSYFVKNFNLIQFGGLPAVGDELSPLSVPPGADGSVSFFLFRWLNNSSAKIAAIMI
jgi:hypothetical protein